ncbi:MAG: chitobiase/beta-hexosaminidase C-terminal domain-containing protein [Blautia sp.]
MKCTNCGTEFKDGKLFCPVCGKEVQWVPEYNTVETIIRQKELQEKALKEKKKKEEQAQRERQRQEMARKKKKRKKMILTGFLGAATVLCAVTWFAIYQTQYNSFDVQMAQAESEFSNKDYKNAMKYLERALELQPDNAEANILQAKIYIVDGEETKALSTLLAAIETSPDSVSAYGELLRLYEKQKNYQAIKELLDSCMYQNIKERYSQYICPLPVVSLDGGVYDKKQTVNFTAMEKGTRVYYTLDGTIPDQNSTLYNEDKGISLDEEGDYLLKYIAYNAKGIPSDTGIEHYTIAFKEPDAPRITPDSGQYEYARTIHVFVPSGCTAYYAFDETVTPESTKYTGPVQMQSGEHIFSAILVDENGKVSSPASATYVLYE